MKNLELNKLMKEIEAKIIEALIEIGLKPSKVLENKNQECHLITLKNKITHKTHNDFSLLSFPRSPLCRENADEIESSRDFLFQFWRGIIYNSDF